MSNSDETISATYDQDLQQCNSGFILIQGCPRSGTYLIASMLSKYFNVKIPIETHFIPLFAGRIQMWGDLTLEKNRIALLADIYAFQRIWLKFAYGASLGSKIYTKSILSTEVDADYIVQHSSSYSDIVDNIFSCYANKVGSIYCADKSVSFDHISPELFQSSVSNMKMIHVIRDGRDVAMSWMKTWFGPVNITHAAMQWKKHVAGKRSWGASNDNSYLEVRYEDLLQNEAKVISMIADFLGVDKNVVGIDKIDDMADVLQSAGTHDLLSGPIQADNMNKWKTNMLETDKRIFNMLASNELKLFGYETEGEVRRLALVMAMSVQYARSFFCVNCFKRWVKNRLPVMIYFARKLGIGPVNHSL